MVRSIKEEGENNMRHFLSRSHMCSKRRADMICLEAEYFNLNRILLQSIALWPLQQSKLVQFQSTLILIILITAIMCEVTTLIMSKVSPKIVVTVLSRTLFLMLLIVHYSAFRINIKSIKNLLQQVHHVCTKLTDKNEIAIIQQYGWEAKRYTTTLLALCSEGTGFFLSQIAVAFYKVDLSINGTRPPRLQIATENILGEQNFFHLILLHIDTAIILGVIAWIAMGTFMIAYLQHTCGMFKIACYRIENAIGINISKDINQKRGPSISEKIICAVNIHREAMRLSEHLISMFDPMYLCLTVTSVITVSLNFFQISDLVTSEDIRKNIPKVIIPIASIFIIIMYVSLANLIGQNIIDHNNEVYNSAYSIPWYMCPPHIQRLILFLLERKTKEFHLTCGGLFIASFECLATLAKATMSYFAFIYSA
ncbi:uncharacterized protein LOC105286929 isoform X2 [Ooceraea biroi]|uniref:uncharacterized protein LOC105286929 isoform X2 n=1 Tax=Ooceraea biroi TaxID=2015173 RepID=UPI000971736B|nr:uncharacterized protein LOC105286929 isoform X2 [Ooceraea biroi]